MKTVRAISISLVFALAAGVSGCGDDDSGPTGPKPPIAVSGTASKGAIEGANANLHRFTASGGMGALVAGPFVTDADGGWTGEVPSGTDETLLVAVDGGSYVDEATGNTVDLTSPLYGIWRPSTKIGNASPVTHAMVLNAQQRVIEGATISSALSDAIGEMEIAFGYDVTAVTPALTKGGGPTPEQLYALFLAGLSQLLDDDVAPGAFSGADLWALVLACSGDLSDGALQGLDVFGNPILVDPDGSGPGTPIQIPVIDAQGIDGWIDAANAWGLQNSVGFTLPYLDLDEFGDTGGSIGGGDATVSGFLNVSGSDASTFGSPYTPELVEFAANPPAIAFAFGTFDARVLAVGLALGEVWSVTAAVGGIGWGATGGLGLPVPGISVTNQGSEWILQFEGVDLAGTAGTTGNLVFSGVLTVIVTEE